MKRLILVGLVISVVLLGACTTSPAPPQPITPGAIAVTAEELYLTYEENEAAADAKYKDKLLEVTGVISSVGEEILPVPYIMLSGGGEYEALGVQCLFDEEYEPQLAQLEKGQTVVVLGTCDGYMMDVILNECALIQ